MAALLRLRATAASLGFIIVIVVVDDDHFAGPRFLWLLRHLVIDVLLNLERGNQLRHSSFVIVEQQNKRP